MPIDWLNQTLPEVPRERHRSGHVAPFAAILLLHVAFFYALQNGLLQQAARAIPKEVIATFITPEPKRDASEPPKPHTAPKTVSVVKKALAQPRPVATAVNATPSPQAINAPSESPTPPIAETPAQPVAAASAPTAPTLPKTVTTGIAYLQAPQPAYPPISRRMGEEGKTVLRVLVSDKGRPERVEVQTGSGFPRLDEAARQAVLRALFKPFMEEGKPVAAYAIVPIRFQLDN